jgi:multimeric flavodoxin WrbA
MRKILIIDGSPRAGQTQKAVRILLTKLDEEFSCEVVHLREKQLQHCKGCAACLSRGEEFCPAKDDLAGILRQMDAADAIVFATPTYSLHLPGLFKNFFDRLAFVYHRPRFFNKAFASLITQGVYGGNSIDKYFKTTFGFWGGYYAGGTVLTLVSGAYNPSKEWNEAEKERVDRELDRLAAKLREELAEKKTYSPSLFRIFMFRLTRTSYKLSQDESKDRQHFQKMGWFESDYFYPVKLNPLQKLVGTMADFFAGRMMKK